MKIKSKNIYSSLIFLAVGAANAGTIGPYDPARDSTAVLRVCTTIGDILSTPLKAFQTFLSSNSLAVTVMYTVFAVAFILETMWHLVRTYLQHRHEGGHNVVIELVIRMIMGTFLLFFVNLAAGRDIFSVGTVSGDGSAPNGLVTAIFDFFMTIASSFGSGSTKVVLFSNGIINGSSYQSVITQSILAPIGTACDSYLFNFFNLTRNMSGNVFGIVGALYNLYAIICIGIVVLFALKIAWGLVFKIAEMIFVTYATVFMVGFIGSSWTRSYFDRYLSYIVSLAIEFFVLSVMLNFVLSYLFNSDSLVGPGAQINAWDPLTLAFRAVIAYQLVALSPKIAAAISAGSPQISMKDSAATAAGALAGTAAAYAGMAGGGVAALEAGGATAKAGMQVAGGALGGMKTGIDAAGLTGRNSIVGALAGSIKGAGNAWSKEGGAKDTLRNTAMGAAVKSAAAAGASMLGGSGANRSTSEKMKSAIKTTCNSMRSSANVAGDLLSRIHNGPMTNSTSVPNISHNNNYADNQSISSNTNTNTITQD